MRRSGWIVVFAAIAVIWAFMPNGVTRAYGSGGNNNNGWGNNGWGNDDDKGPKGPTGPTGPTGPAGSAALVVTEVCATEGVAASGNFEINSPTCPVGDIPVSGGYVCEDTTSNPLLVITWTNTFFGYPAPTGWVTGGTNDSTSPGSCRVCVTCTPGSCPTCPPS
jgi:hypothetical protein